MLSPSVPDNDNLPQGLLSDLSVHRNFHIPTFSRERDYLEETCGRSAGIRTDPFRYCFQGLRSGSHNHDLEAMVIHCRKHADNNPHHVAKSRTVPAELCLRQSDCGTRHVAASQSEVWLREEAV